MKQLQHLLADADAVAAGRLPSNAAAGGWDAAATARGASAALEQRTRQWAVAAALPQVSFLHRPLR